MKTNLIQIGKIIVIDIIITVLATLLLSFLLYKFRFGEGVLKIGIIVVYIISNFVGGYIIGKIKENKKYLWGAAQGFTYFLLLTIVSLTISGQLHGNESMVAAALLSSVLGGSAGGMVS